MKLQEPKTHNKAEPYDAEHEHMEMLLCEKCNKK